MNKRQIGAEYEALAVRYLKEQGYAIVKQNYRNPKGEIDILAQKDGVLIVIEVKYRKGDSCGDPLEAVDWKKQRRIGQATVYYYMEQGFSMEHPCRFDVIGVYGDGRIKHVKNAFEYSV